MVAKGQFLLFLVVLEPPLFNKDAHAVPCCYILVASLFAPLHLPAFLWSGAATSGEGEEPKEMFDGSVFFLV